MNDDVRWVITVPAIWKQSAKQFMREAAYQVCHFIDMIDEKIKMFGFILQAGIASREFPEQLLIALEPEAASIYIRKLRLHQFISDDNHPPYSRHSIRREHGTISSASYSNQSSPILYDSDKCLFKMFV